VIGSNEDVWIVIPVYNEEKVIADVVENVLATFPNVVCVDDGSADGSAQELLSTRAHLVRHPINMGQGAALQTGLSYALARTGGRFFVTFDADGQHRVEDAAAMVDLARSGAADVVLGSRFLGRRAESVPWIKRLVLRTAAFVSPTARRLKLTDAHNGLRVFGRTVADSLNITMSGMSHASEIISLIVENRWRVAEEPVEIIYTDYSMSKGQPLVNGVNIIFDGLLRRRMRR